MASRLKSVLITGCSAGGIGGGLADAFHEAGYHVFATARTPSKISPSLAKAPNVTSLALDVLSPESIAAAVESVTRVTGGKLDVLVNNSGTLMVMPALDVSIEEGKRHFDTNYWAVLAMVQAFAPLLIKAKGYVVNNTSVSGLVPFGAFGSIYNSSKAAAILGSETWRLELAPLGVRTLTLVTAGVKSNVFSNVKPPIIPKTSYYYGIRDWIVEQLDGRMQKDGITAKEFGDKVVRQVEKGTTGKYWVGGGAAGARIAAWLLPDWMMDMLIVSMFPFGKMLQAQSKVKNN
ncbi:short-chain dehydrogenase/reductase [Exophiala viscosa]|uniref:Short-chain dehydrogenase/reductase n=1 Tax=Exophiala viscosa TaxID=2486360 RepID=A0AAN6IBV6_9EURO|nr:short-chain dehydrogenase/reductase [Exophiala viscosa]